MCSFTLYLHNRVLFGDVSSKKKKVVEIKCKLKQNKRGIEHKAGKVASSTVPWLSSFAISGTACAQCSKEEMKNKSRERRGTHDAELSRSGNNEMLTSFFCSKWWQTQIDVGASALQSSIKAGGKITHAVFVILLFFPAPTKVVLRQIFAHLWSNSAGECRLNAHQEPHRTLVFVTVFTVVCRCGC